MYRVVVNICAQNYVRITNLRMKKNDEEKWKKKREQISQTSHI